MKWTLRGERRAEGATPATPRRSRGTVATGGRRWFGNTSLALLGLGCVLLVAVALQAHAAVRSHRATVDQLLTDYARAAAWNYRQRADPNLAALLEHLFHPLHGVSFDPISPHLPPMERVRHTPHPEESCSVDVGETSHVLRFLTSGGKLEVLGGEISDFESDVVRNAVVEQVRAGLSPFGSEGVVGVAVSGGPVLAVYSRLIAGADTVVYVLPVRPEALRNVFSRALEEDPLLPAPLVEDIPGGELLTVRVEVPGAGALYESAAEFPDRFVAYEPLGGDGTYLRASVGLSPSAAASLVVGGLPRSRLPVLLALLALAAALLGVAFVQLRREHELAAMRANFVSSVSHELRTPLALQRVFIDTLKLGRAESADQRAWALRHIDRETDRLTHLVDNVLRFARVGDGRLELNPEPTSLAREIADIVADFRPLASSYGTKLVFRSADASIVAPIDRDGLRQVLRNLLENAAKYGPRGQRVDVELEVEEDCAVISVTDEGDGVSVKDREAIWTPFQRGEAAIASATGGSGIGLSVVKEIVSHHGGTVGVEDGPSRGARFTVTFPGAHRIRSEEVAPPARVHA